MMCTRDTAASIAARLSFPYAARPNSRSFRGQRSESPMGKISALESTWMNELAGSG